MSARADYSNQKSTADRPALADENNFFQDLSLNWGHNGSRWRIIKYNKKIIEMIDNGSAHNSIYSVETFNSIHCKKVIFKLKIVSVYAFMTIGIVNNHLHKNTYFDRKDIPNNNNNINDDDSDDMNSKQLQHIYYAIDGRSGWKKSSSDVRNMQWTKRGENAGFVSGDVISLMIDFENLSIYYGKNSIKFDSPMYYDINPKQFENIDFRLVVTSNRKDDCVELLSCKAIVHSIRWSDERIIWIGFYNNKNNNKCLIQLLPKDIVLLVLRFLKVESQSSLQNKKK